MRFKEDFMKRQLALLLVSSMILSCAACGKTPDASETATMITDTAEPTETSDEIPGYKYELYATMTPEEIVADLTLEQKAAQMVMGAETDTGFDYMGEYGIGSIYGGYGRSMEDWQERCDGYMQAAIESDAGIPFIYGQDDVHGVGYCINAVYFPQNIGLGAANDEDLMYQMGLIVADETLICHMPWNLYPCVAQSNDPRWGRTYESYGTDLDRITALSTAYTRGLVDGGAVACAKHYFGDGNVIYGTGESSGGFDRLIDRGDTDLTDEEIAELVAVYQAQIDAGVQTIMVSYTSLNGMKMHENPDYIWLLKNEMGFEGFIVSDYDGIQGTSPETYEEQIILGINCGIDLYMEGTRYDEARQIIIDAVNNGDITMERIDDAVTRIIRVKKDAGLFDDPFFENRDTVQTEVGSMEYRAVAEQLVEKSLVLLKNDNDVLPLTEGTKVYIMGPACDNPRVQCGGWTIGWVESTTKDIEGVTTILEAFERYSEDYGIEVVTDPEEADVVILCVGERSYAEWYGDTEDLELCGMMGLEENRDAIDEAAALGKPTVTCIVAGRQVIPDQSDYADWDSVVMCYLPGSEGKGISDVLCGCGEFSGRLPEPWYGSVDQILTDECFLEEGYGLSYPDGFEPRTEPVALPDEPAQYDSYEMFTLGTNYTPGTIEDGVYSSSYFGFSFQIPDGYNEIDSYRPEDLEGGLKPEGTWEPESTMAGVQIYCFNTSLYLHDGATMDELMAEFWEADFVSTETVTLAGNEWTRYIDGDTLGDQPYPTYLYVHQIEDDMFVMVMIFDEPGIEHEIDYYDQYFGEPL